MNERDIFIAARLIPETDARNRYLEKVCGGDADLRRRVEDLLQADDQAGSFLAAPAAAFQPTAGAAEISEVPGTQIGPYKILQQIGEGGMGTVFMAEQSEPVQRRVAIKIIKPGMDSRQVIARFAAEKQALALMDHVNIARVLDAGVTEQGRPYFVMELVHGVPITKYCDDNHLTPRQRLELFVPVCQAIQHAHQKGIIHRDIKPSNVMITLYDGKPVPKVIDFGVAKAMDQKLTEQTLFTQYGTMVGTLEYMSPEQAEMSALGVDTRSDIYSLGVLLYELLTGSTPLSSKQMKEAAFGEILRMIREEEPPKPSTRLSESGESLASISALRHTEPAKLSKLMRGELDWIVMKTLEKDRNRRYGTANAFADDVQRYLNDEPVQACPPSAWYRFHKFARRNKTGFAVAALLLFVAVCLCSGIGWGIRDRAAVRQQAAMERNAQELSLAHDMDLALKEAQGSYQRGKLPEALAELRRAEAILASTRGDHEKFTRELDLWRSDLRMAIRLEGIRLERAASRVIDEELKRETFDWRGTDVAYQQAFKDYGLELDAVHVDEATRRIRGSAIPAALVQALDDWVWSKREAGLEGGTQLIAVARQSDPEPWRDRVRATFEARSSAVVVKLAEEKDVVEQPPATLLLLASLLRSHRETSRAIDVLQRGQLQHPADFWINFMLAEHLAQQATPDYEAAIGFYRAALALRPESPGVYIGLGTIFFKQREYARAEAAFRKGIDVRPAEASARAALGWMLMRQGKSAAAEEMLRAAIRVRPGHTASHAYLASLLSEQERWSEALDAYDRANVESSNYAPSFAGLAQLLATCPELSLRNSPRAVLMAQRAVDLAPDSGWNWQILGWALYRAGEWQASIEALEKSMALQKGPPGGDSFQWFFLAMAHWQLGHQDGAVKWYTKSVDWTEINSPGNTNALAFRAEATSLISAEAIVQWYEKAHIGQPDSAETLTQRGAMLARLGKFDAALESFLRAIELARMSNAQPNQIYQTLMRWDSLFPRLAEQQPDNVQLWIERGRFLARRRRWTAAAEAYTRVTEASRPVYEYAMVLLLADDREGYRRLCEKLNETSLQPPPAESAWHLAVVCSAGAGSGVDSARLVSWAEASVQKKRDKFTLHALSAALYRAGRHEEAIRFAHEGLDLGVSTSTTSFLLALAYHGAGKKAESQTWYDIGLKELEAATPKNPDDPGPWAISHWLNFNLMAREARDVLGGEVAAEKPAVEKSKP